ncbi:MAG: hypothetical protein JW904_01040 [Spirochaetales bacterium]|nr:hypothetical protein [Spirochaetales bacterium]
MTNEELTNIVIKNVYNDFSKEDQQSALYELKIRNLSPEIITDLEVNYIEKTDKQKYKVTALKKHFRGFVFFTGFEFLFFILYIFSEDISNALLNIFPHSIVFILFMLVIAGYFLSLTLAARQDFLFRTTAAPHKKLTMLSPRILLFFLIPPVMIIYSVIIMILIFHRENKKL